MKFFHNLQIFRDRIADVLEGFFLRAALRSATRQPWDPDAVTFLSFLERDEVARFHWSVLMFSLAGMSCAHGIVVCSVPLHESCRPLTTIIEIEGTAGLREYGFQQVKVTGRSGDGGIDGQGVVHVSPFVSFQGVGIDQIARGEFIEEEELDARVERLLQS